MKKHISLIAACLILACSGEPGKDGAQGPAGEQGEVGEPGTSCSVQDNGDGTVILSCGDETSVDIQTEGEPGEDGTSCTVIDNPDGTEALLQCEDGTSVVISDGTDGAPGADGQDGKDAEATRIIESFHCNGGLENTSLEFSYNAVLMSSGDLFVSVEVNSPLNSASNTVFYAPTQNGYKTAQAIVRFDQDGTADGGWFTLSLDRVNLVTIIDYYPSDPGVVSNSWTMQPEVCVHNFY
jgi:hypothetical protein